MKKILFAIPTLGGGGAERVLINLLNDLDKEKYQITLFTLFDGGVNKKYLDKEIQFKTYFKKVFRGNIHLLKLITPQKLYKLMIKDEFDIIISYLEGPMARIVSGCPYLETRLISWIHIEVHNQKYLQQSYRSFNELEESYNKYDSIIFVSHTAKVAFEKTFPTIEVEKNVIYNTVDYKTILTKAEEAITDLVLDESTINLVSVGRYAPQKGYKRLLFIISELANEGYDIHLYLIGKGELEAKYNQVIKELNLSDYVTLLGFKENPYKYVKNSDAFICSSYSEGFSTAVTESLIIGTPVVTTLCSGMTELLGNNNEFGIITENSDRGLLEGLKRILDEPDVLKDYKEKALERGKTFSNDEHTKEVEAILDK